LLLPFGGVRDFAYGRTKALPYSIGVDIPDLLARDDANETVVARKTA